MTRLSQMNVLWTFVACLLTTAVRTQTIAYMDLQIRAENFTGCGDTVEGTISGRVYSFIPRFSPDLNCSLALFSPPGTRLSLTVNEVKLSNSNLNTCGGGNRLKILGSNEKGATSLLPTFPHGLCGHFKPSQPIESTGNQVFLILRSVRSTVDISFSIKYTAFKTVPDESCYRCEVSGLRDTEFCIDNNLVCDGEQNCPQNSYSEENNPTCSASRPTPAPGGSSLSIAVIVVIVILMVVLLAIIIFTILALMAKRVHSKRARDSVRRPQRASQSRQGNPSQGGGDRRPTPDSRHPDTARNSTGAPTFTTEGEYTDDLNFTERPVGEYTRDGPPAERIMNPAGAPPPYSTLPRPYEESLQIAEGTTPISRSRLASINNDLENH